MYSIFGLCLIWLAYAYRFSKLSREFSVRLEERVGERTRIARELHDTLLQSFQGLLLRFQAVHNILPEGLAKNSLEVAIDRAADAITEGRDAVQALRQGGNRSEDLVQTLTSLGQQLGADHAAAEQAATEQAATPVAFRVLVEGKRQEIRAPLHDDLCRIASEAIRNAFRHARGNRIEVDLRYGRRTLRLRIRDDGVGMDPELLTPIGRAGHWGLPGMRERAKRISGRLDVWSQLNRGTEVEVTIPGAIAYTESADRDDSSNLNSQDEQ
jgi:signal transduction histidine kinase